MDSSTASHASWGSQGRTPTVAEFRAQRSAVWGASADGSSPLRAGAGVGDPGAGAPVAPRPVPSPSVAASSLSQEREQTAAYLREVASAGSSPHSSQPSNSGRVRSSTSDALLTRLDNTPRSLLAQAQDLAAACSALAAGMPAKRRASNKGVGEAADAVGRVASAAPSLARLLPSAPRRDVDAALRRCLQALRRVHRALYEVSAGTESRVFRGKAPAARKADLSGGAQEAVGSLLAAFSAAARPPDGHGDGGSGAVPSPAGVEGDEASGEGAEASDMGNPPATADAPSGPMDADSALLEAERFRFGVGRPQSLSRAAAAYAAAARAGCGPAWAALGALYRDGRGVERDSDRAVRCFRAGVGAGCDEARTCLAAMLCAGLAPGSATYTRDQERGGGAPAEAADVEEVDVQEGLALYQTAADNGHARAQNNLGSLLLAGRVRPRRTHGKQSTLGEGAAESVVGMAGVVGSALSRSVGGGKEGSENGSGEEPADSRAIAVSWFQRAADQGYAPAQNNLATCLLRGSGCRRNPAAAVRWFRRAARQDNAAAAHNLASCYESGVGVEASVATAMEWYRKAAEAGHPAAECALGFLLLREAVAMAPPPVEVALRPGDASGDAAGRVVRATSGGAEAPSPAARRAEEAERWLRRAADGGVEEAHFHLGTLLQRGVPGRAADPAAAHFHYRRAAAAPKSHPAAAERAALMCYAGRGTARDEGEARRWYTVAAEGGRRNAMTALGLMLEEGRGGTRDASRACSWYRRAAHLGDPSAMLALAAAYINGAGVRPSADAAQEWLAQAEEAGAPRASVQGLRRRAEGLAEEAAFRRRSLHEAALSGDAAVARYMVGREAGEEGGDTARSIQERAREEVDRRAAARRRRERETMLASFEHARSREQRMAEEELGFRTEGKDEEAPVPQQRSGLHRGWQLSVGTDTDSPGSDAVGRTIAALPCERPAKGGEGTVLGSTRDEDVAPTD